MIEHSDTSAGALIRSPRAPAPDHLARVVRHSVIVRGLRAVYCLAAAGALILLVGASILSDIGGAPIKVPDFIPGVMLSNPRFFGRDREQGDYVLRAISASPRSADVFDLVAPVFENADKHMVRANNGVYDREHQTLSMQGAVTYSGSDAAERLLSCTRAELDLVSRTLRGENVRLSDPLATFRADRFDMSDDYRLVRFHGNVRTRIEARVLAKEKDKERRQ